MHGTRSLNLATAVAIVLFEAVRQQQMLIKTSQRSGVLREFN